MLGVYYKIATDYECDAVDEPLSAFLQRRRTRKDAEKKERRHQEKSDRSY